MLAIRMKRIGRRGTAQFRVVVQDSRQSPKSGKFVAQLGSYNPHTKTSTLVKDKAEIYLKNGAQPSERVASLFKSEGIKLPDWVVAKTKKAGTIRNQDKLRRNRPAEAEKPKPTVAADSKPAETNTIENNSEQTETTNQANEPTKAEAKTKEPADSSEDNQSTAKESADIVVESKESEEAAS